MRNAIQAAPMTGKLNALESMVETGRILNSPVSYPLNGLEDLTKSDRRSIVEWLRQNGDPRIGSGSKLSTSSRAGKE